MNNLKHIKVVTQQKASVLIRKLDDESINYDYRAAYETVQSRKIASHTKLITKSALISGFLTFISVILFQYWSSTDFYRLNIGNKPFFTFATVLPYAFELSILAAGLSAFIAFLHLIHKYKMKSEHKDTDETVFIILGEDFQSFERICKENEIEYKLYD